MAWLTARHGEDEDDNFGVDWVLHYDVENIEQPDAVKQFQTLIRDIDAVGLQTEVRHGRGASLLVFLKAPTALVGNWIYKSRVRDWLYGISDVRPIGDRDVIVDGDTEAETLRSMYHLVTYPKEKGGAGITPNFGQWENIKACFPLHNQASNNHLLKRWSRSIVLEEEDLDDIRALFGEKVAFYFAFIQCYSIFLIFPALLGFFCWLILGPYSIMFACLNCLWGVVFVEYWKQREVDLSIRWGVKGVGVLKLDRVQYTWQKEVVDPITKEITKVFPVWKQLLRQSLQIPFGILACLALGTLIVFIFAMEEFIAEFVEEPLVQYLSFLPTIIYSIFVPTITSVLTNMADRLTDFENHRTHDQYEQARTQKTFVLSFITAFLPIFITAFVYIPFGSTIVSFLHLNSIQILGFVFLTPGSGPPQHDFHVDPSRLQQEVIYLTVSAQVLSFGEEMILPYAKRILLRKFRNYRFQGLEAAARRNSRGRSATVNLLLADPPGESNFLTRVRNESDADEYSVQDDILEMCVQFGYLVMFGASWPLVPLGFLINNWIELRSDFLKIAMECQRPAPIRADSIGPWLAVLEFLTWLGTLSTAAIVHLYRGPVSVADDGAVKLSLSLLVTVFVAEQVYLATQYLVRSVLQQLGTETQRREAARQYAVRKRYLETFNEETAELSRRHQPHVRFNSQVDMGTSAPSLEKKPLVRTGTADSITDPYGLFLHRTNSDSLHARDDPERTARFWSWQRTGTETIEAGVKLIRALTVAQRSRPSKQTFRKEKV